MKILFRSIHLYLGLAAGLVIMSCCFSGAVLVFEKELQEAFHRDRYFVEPGTLHLPIEQLITNVKEKYPVTKVSSVRLYPDTRRSVEISLSIPRKGEKQATVPGGASIRSEGKAGRPPGMSEKGSSPSGGVSRPTHTAFVNPYTGAVLELYNYRETFFFTMFSLHRWLLGSESSIGKTITGVATLIFVFILITGIILWWPRNKAILKQRLKVKTRASWKRVNHDLHIVLGFYSAIFLFVFAFTALAWSFKWFNNGIYAVTGSSMKPAEPPHSNVAASVSEHISYDAAFIAVNNVTRDAQYYSLRAPNDSTGAFVATVLPLNAHESGADNYYIDQYTGKILGTLRYKDKNLGQQVRSVFKPIHTGSIYGWPSKIVACVVCLLGVTFPVSGVIMWLNRLKKNNKTKNSAEESFVIAGNDEDLFARR